MEQRRKITLAQRIQLRPMAKLKKETTQTSAKKQPKQQRSQSKAAPNKKIARKKPGRAKQSAPAGKQATRKKKGGR